MKKYFKWIFVALFIVTIHMNRSHAVEHKNGGRDFSHELKMATDSLQQKANINTSRSNIKQPRKSSEIGVNEPGVNRKESSKSGKTVPAGHVSQKDKAERQKK